jgi:dipeptidyl aminopeptidase/acylaminoacyl peptidase
MLSAVIVRSTGVGVVRGLLACALGALASASFAAELPVDTFYSALSYPEMVLSPSGRYIAALYPNKRTYNLAVIDTQGMTSKPLTDFTSPRRVTGVGWDGDDRLIYTLVALSAKNEEVSEIAAVNRDGGNPLLIQGTPAYESLVDWTIGDPKTVLLSSDAEKPDFPSVYLVNTWAVWNPMKSEAAANRLVFSTRRTRIVTAPGRKCDYFTDSQGVVRACYTQETTGARRLLYRTNDKSQWVALTETTSINALLVPLGFASDDRTLYVFSNRGRDTVALFEYDPEQRKLGRLVFEAPGYDVTEGLWSADHRRLLGVSYHETRGRARYFDEHAAQVQKNLLGLFPDDTISIRDFSQDGARALVLVQNERTPGAFYLYDDMKGTVEHLAARAPWIEPPQMSEVKAVSYAARDGLQIPGYLTLPRGKEPKKLPLIVFPHGGPYAVRDVATFDRDAQFFASRGYAVLQMNFRGSGGYGTKFREAGNREWGGKMQDDVTDGVKWAVSEGIADANRVCIFGASYGGYAALMGAATTPELYRCAISYVGVTDLETMFQPRIIGRSGMRDRTPEELEFIRRVVGDRREAAWLTARSPVSHAAQIACPVFIAHGERDLVVPFSNAQAMRAALEREHKTVEFFSRPDEAHGFVQDANEIALFTRIAAFLKKYNPPD